ncbi:MAG: Metalloprotease PmbA [Alphaproteobacteria bacterium MarineAlpha2_Bin1]|nr:MAG: Metalloprotease PmbA [Alphaproteobacteria bacterium MarineAlpha2_Bin1]
MEKNLSKKNKSENILTKLIDKAKARGADSADAISLVNESISVSQRLGKREDLERSESSGYGLRIFIGKKQSIVSSSNNSDYGIDELIGRAIEMAKVAPDDPYAGISEKNIKDRSFPNLNLLDKFEPSIEDLYENISIAEEAALSVKGITNSEGADSSWSKSTIALANTNGFFETYSGSTFSLSAAVIAGDGSTMERDYDYSVSRHRANLENPKSIGINAAERAVKRLNPIKIDSCELPVIFDWRVASSILGHFSSAINGQSIAKKTSFLNEKMDKQIFNKEINIIDDPHIVDGLGSRPFDGEASETRKINLVSDGVLKSWILDLSSSRQLGLTTTGHASRGTSSIPFPSTTNLYLEPGKNSLEDIIGGLKRGIYVTELIGMGVNGVTGDYSRGAAGFLVENGKITYPISEITIAGNLNSIFSNLTPANDLKFKNRTNSPSLLINKMTVAGN